MLVRINAGNVAPLDTGDYNWFRNDLRYEVVGELGPAMQWHAYTLPLGGDAGVSLD